MILDDKKLSLAHASVSDSSRHFDLDHILEYDHMRQIGACIAKDMSVFFRNIPCNALHITGCETSITAFKPYRALHENPIYIVTRNFGSNTDWTALSIDPKMIDTLITLRYGGTISTRASGDCKISPSVMSCIERLNCIVSNALKDSRSVEFENRNVCNKVETDWANISIEDELLLVYARIVIALPCERSAHFDIFRPLRSGVSDSADVTTEKFTKTTVWQTLLESAALQIPLQLKAILAEPVFSIADASTLEVGDVFPIGQLDTLHLTLNGVQYAKAALGQVAEKAAVRIQKLG